MLAMGEAAAALVDDERAGVLLVASSGDRLVGLLGASWQLAVHTAGR